MKQNPFTGAMIFAWAVFSAMAVIGEFKPKAIAISKQLTGRPVSEKTRALHSANMRAKNWKPSKFVLARSRAFWLGRKQTAQHIAKRSRSLSGRTRLPEHIRASALNYRKHFLEKRGLPNSEPVGHKYCSACLQLLPLSAYYPQPAGYLGRQSQCKKCMYAGETARKRYSQPPRKRTLSPEACRAMSIARKGKKKSSETRARMRAAWIRRKSKGKQ